MAHDNETARQLAEITRLKTTGLAADYAANHADVDAYHLEAFERVAALAEFRGGNTTKHTNAVGDLAAEIGHAIGPATRVVASGCGSRPACTTSARSRCRDTVLLKPGPLTVEEYDEVKPHTVLGRRLLGGVSTELFCSWPPRWRGRTTSGGTVRAIRTVSTDRDPAVRSHRRDRRRLRLAGDSERVYKREWNLAEAVRFVMSGAGTQFQPDLVDAFVKVMIARHPELSDELR